MFKCQATGRMSLPNEKAHRLVTHIRSKTYFGRPKRKRTFERNDDGEGTMKSRRPISEEPEIIGHGYETVREILVSGEHYAKLMAEGFRPQLVREKE